MSIEVWLTFLAASAVLCFTPGPTVFLVVGQALAHGRKSLVPLILGVFIGDIVLMTLSVLGLGVLLSMSSTLFNMMKLAGAAYLIYLGVKAFTAKRLSDASVEEVSIKGSSTKIFRDAMIATTLNPKAILFFLAFFPLFLTPGAPMLPQLLVLASSFLALSLASVGFYGLLSNQLRERMIESNILDGVNKVGGCLLVGAGLITAGLQRN